MDRKARAKHSREQRAKAPEHPICAPCGNKACAEGELLSASSSCASVPDAGGPAAIALAAPAPIIHESPVAIESDLGLLASAHAPLPLWEKGLRKAQASSPAAAGYRRAGKTSCAAMMSDLYQRLQMSNPYQRDEVACGAPQDKFPVHTDTNPVSKPENAFEAAAEEAARAAGSSQIACGSSQIACGSSQIAAGSSQIAW